jgi:hypothetical protein
VLRDPWAARDDYVRVLIGAVGRDEFVDEWVVDGGDPVVALTLLEAARHSMAMYTSCGWFFNDLAGLETVQDLRYAARALDCLEELGEPVPLQRFLSILATAESNVVEEGNGADIWTRHVEPARVDAERVVAHLALVELLEGREPATRVATFDVSVTDHGHRDRGVLAMCWGSVVLTHRRTKRRTEHVYAALHLGGLEVLGATRPPGLYDEAEIARLQEAFATDAPVTTLLRLVSDGFGSREFGLASALPDAAEQILQGAARALSYRFARAYDQLFSDHRPTLTALAAAGYQLPPELRAPAEMALARRLESAVAGAAGSLDPEDYTDALAIVREARANGVTLEVPMVQEAVDRLILIAVERTILDPSRLVEVQGLLLLSGSLGMVPIVGRAQELVFDAVTVDGRDDLLPLAAALGLVI